MHSAIPFFAFLFICFSQISVLEGMPHHNDDRYTPVIRFLKELRRARKYGSAGAGSGVLPIKDADSVGSGTTQDSGAIRVGVGNSDAQRQQETRDVNAQLDQTLQQISAQLPTQPPYPIERVNAGLRTLLGGVNNLNLGDILRGSFTFTRNENVRSVANTVIDSIFGANKAAEQPSAPLTAN